MQVLARIAKDWSQTMAGIAPPAQIRMRVCTTCQQPTCTDRCIMCQTLKGDPPSAPLSLARQLLEGGVQPYVDRVSQLGGTGIHWLNERRFDPAMIQIAGYEQRVETLLQRWHDPNLVQRRLDARQEWQEAVVFGAQPTEGKTELGSKNKTAMDAAMTRFILDQTDTVGSGRNKDIELCLLSARIFAHGSPILAPDLRMPIHREARILYDQVARRGFVAPTARMRWQTAWKAIRPTFRSHWPHTVLAMDRHVGLHQSASRLLEREG